MKEATQDTSDQLFRWGPSLSSILSFVLVVLPFTFIFALAILLIIPVTHKLGVWLLLENHLIEMLSSVIALWAAIEGVRFFKLLQKQHGIYIRGFICVFTLMMFFLAMEEISWGQQLFGFSTPEYWKERNFQNELTLHNYDFVGVNYLEIYPLLFAACGLIGIGMRTKGLLPWVISPSIRMWAWFAVIFIHSAVDLSHEFYILSPGFDSLINELDEAAEFLVACSGLLYLLLNRYSLKTYYQSHPKIGAAGRSVRHGE